MNTHATASADSMVHSLEVVLPEQANHYGTLYGANALQMMGKAAFICATRHVRCPVVMAKADAIRFLRPIRIGSIVDVRASVVEQRRSSLDILVEIVPDAAAGAAEESAAITGRFVMVSVDDAGAPIPIPVSDQPSQEDILP